MTDEKKAKKYVKEKINHMKVGNFKLMEISHLSNGTDIYNPKVEHLLQDKIKQAYLDGLAKGRKESKEYITYLKRQRQGGIQKQFNKANKIKRLEKENTELKAKLKEGELFIENILKASADNLNEFFELRKENEELKKNQIKWVLDSIPEDKEKLCIIKDKDGYYIDSFNNLSSTDQKNIEKWAYLPL